MGPLAPAKAGASWGFRFIYRATGPWFPALFFSVGGAKKQ